MTDPPMILASAAVSDLLAARLQTAFTLGCHIILASLGVGLPVLMLLAQWRFLKIHDEGWPLLFGIQSLLIALDAGWPEIVRSDQ